MTASEYRGEVRPRRRPTRHNIIKNAAQHSTQPITDPFGPISTKQFPALYVRNPVRNQYRRYMRQKSIYQHYHQRGF